MKILRHYRITPEVDAMIKAEAARLKHSEATVIEMAIAHWCDVGPDDYMPTKKVSKKDKAIEQRASSDLTAQVVERKDIDYSDVESTPTTHIANVVRPIVMKPVTQAMASWRAGRKPLLKPKNR